MRTNVLNDLSNVVKKGTSRVQVGYKVEEETLAGSWSRRGQISGEGAIEHPLSTHSAPFGIRWKPAGEKGATRVWKHVAMIFAVLVMSIANIGMAWGATETITVISNGTSTTSGTIMGNKANSQAGSTLTGCTVSITWTNNSSSVSSKYYAQVQDNSSNVSEKYFRVSVNSGYKINSIKFYLSNTESSNTDTDYGILAWDNDLTPALTNPSYAATGATFSTKKGTFSERTETFTSLSEVQISDVRIYRKISGVTYGSSDLTFGTKGKNLLVQKVDVTVEEIPAATKKIYLKNSMGWATAYVNRLGTSSYWDGTNGSGSNGRNGTYAMTYDSDKKLFYYDAPAGANDTYLCFTKDNQPNYNNFYNTEAVYVDGGYEFGKVVWVSTGETITKNGTKYYNYEDSGIKGADLEPYSEDVYLAGDFNEWAKSAATAFTEDGGTYTKTISLSANTHYKFKIVDNAWFGNTGGIVHSQSNWEFAQSNGDCNFVSGPAGTYTFTYSRTTNQVSVTYPEVSHPNAAYTYFQKPEGWGSCYAHLFTGETPMVSWHGSPMTATATICGTNYYYAAIVQSDYTTVIFNDGGSTQTADWTVSGSGNKHRTYGDADWSNFTTYTISFAGNGNTGGSMSAIEGICPNSNQEITTNAFEKTGYTFNCWHADKAVKVGGSTIAAGDDIAGGATLQEINNDITLTAQWTAVKVSSITVAPSSKTLEVGGTQQLAATVSPDNALDKTVTWSTSDGSVATVSSTGLVTAVAAGTCTITATANDGSGKTGTCSITVEAAAAGNEVAATWPMVSGSSLTLVGSADHASVTPSNAVKAGTNISNLTDVVDASFTDYEGKMAKVTASGTIGESNAVTNDHYLKYTLTVASGYKFTPTGFSATVARFGTDNAYAQVVLKQGATTIKATDASKPNRSGKGAAKTVYSAEFDDASTYSAGTSIDLYIYLGGGMASTKYYGVLAVSITGTYESAACTTPAAPTAFTAGSITSTGATFSITDAANAASYDIYYSESSTAPTASTPATTTSTSKTKAVTGLTASTTYYAWVRSVCDADHKSAWVALGTTSFTTSAAEPTALVTWQMKVDQAAWALKSGTTEDGTNITSIASTADEPGSTSTGITGTTGKVVMASGESNVDKAASFTFTVNSAKKVVPEKVTCKVLNVSSGDRTYKAQLSDNNGHVYYSTNTVSVTTENVLTDATFNFASSLVLTGNVTLKVYAWKTSGSPTQFRMGEYVKLFGEVQNAADYTVTHTLSNVTKSAGATSVKEGNNYTATYAVAGDYALPSTIAVTIGGSPATAGTDYTWTQGTGVVSIPGNKVTGNIVITVTGVAVVNYSITYHCNGAESGCPSNVAATTNLPSPLPTGLTKDGYDFGGWFTDSECTVAAVAGAALTGNTDLYAKWTERGSECEDTPHAWDVIATGAKSYKVRISKVTEEVAIPVADATASNLTAYAGSVSTNDNVTVQIADGGSSQYGYKFDGSNTYLKLVFSTPLVLNDTLVVGMTNASHNISFTTTAARATTLSTSGGKLIIPAALAGQSTIYLWRGSGSTMYLRSFAVKHACDALPSCSTPTLPTLSNQSLCEGADIDAWNATPTNASTISTAGETVTYSWKKKGNATELANTASFDLGSSAAESQAGTYVVTVTVSKTGYASSTATKEVTLTVNEATEVTAITADKATVYPTNSVTLTATANMDATWQWYTCTNAEGAGESSIGGAESASYTITSVGAAGTYYYKAKATGSCGTGSMVYTLTVSAAAGGDCFHYVSVLPDKDISPSSGANIVTPTHATTLEGGTMKVGSQQITITKNGLKLESSKSVSITLDAALEAGNVVIVKGTAASAGNGVSINGVNFYDEDNKSFDVSYTVLADDGLVGKTSLTVTKYSGSSYLQEIKITGCGTACTDPEVTASVNNSTACVGSSVTFTATGAHASAAYQWQKYSGGAWTNIASATAATYNIASVATTDAMKYRVIASHECNRTSNEVTLNVPVAPVFADFTATRSVMATLALSITDVEASDATSYAWYKSANATYDAGSDTRVGTTQELLLASGGEAAGATYYLFCVASNACGSTTSSAITVNVTALVEEDCATRGNEVDAAFGFENTGCSQGTYSETAVWTTNSRSKYLTYTAPEGKYFKTAKVTVAVTSGSKCGYAYSTDGGTTWTYAELASLSSTLTEKTINLSALGGGVIDAFRISRNLQDGGGTDHGVTSGNFHLSKICFEYTDACTATTITVSPTSKTYTIGNSWTAPTITLGPVAVASETLTYTSSDEDIATVDDDGTVNFQGRAGSVTITASYAGGEVGLTDYCASEGSYTITVSCSGDAPKIVAAGSVNMSGCNSSVTLNAKTQAGADFADGTYQWLRNGEEIDGATNKSYTATQAGIYTVEYTSAGGCTSLSTNSATVTSESAEPEITKLVPFHYYHVDKTYTAQMKDRHLFSVKGSAAYGSTGKNFKLTMSRNGGAETDMTTAASIWVKRSDDGQVDSVMIDLNKLSDKYSEGDELVLTCAAVDCSGNVSAVYKDEITINVIGATPTLALICSGTDIAAGTRDTKKLTVGGDFLTGYNVADLCQQTGEKSFDANTEWGLYTRLKENYIVTPVNGYAVFNKLNYEPFDILLLTDYPKASKSNAAKDVLDDMAALCDYRPMLSFKTHMVAKSPSKWAAKGFTTSATENKADGKLNLNIVCYAHPMFESIKEGENVYDDVANSSAPLVYTMLTDVGHEGKKGMQGFELAAAENFVTIGLTHYNASISKNDPLPGEVTWTPGTEDRMLVTVAERQTNIEARFILFSLNCGAQSMLTEKGRTVVLKCLEYLLDDNPLHVADCSFTFDNGKSNEHDASWYSSNCPSCTGTKGDGKWSTAANWGPDYRLLPGEFTSVRIKEPVEVDMEHAHVMSVRILEDGQITIPAGKALDVKSTIRRMDGSEIYPTDVNDIHIGSASTGNGTLIFNNNTGDTKAQVDMYSTAKADMETMSAATSTWQYIGTPHNDVASATRNYYDSWLYQYDTGSQDWTVIPNGGPLVPFRGYCVTHPAAPVVYDMSGTLVATTSADIDVPANKYVVAANSWVAPIDINAITDDDMENISDKAIYFFNTGSDPDKSGTVTENATGDARWAAGTYVTIPINSAPYTGTDDHIPSMQGFYVWSTTAGTLHLNYEKHVRGTTRDNILSGPMHAPKRVQAEDNAPEVLWLVARGNHYDDRLVVLEREDFTRNYESGWDGEAWGGSDLSPMVYITNEAGVDEAVSAIPEFEGTVITFRAGEDSEYRFEFTYSEDAEPLYLFDTENNTYTQIMTGNAYYFTTSDKAPHSRFILTRKAPQIATGTELTSDGEGANAKKLLIEDKMYILLNGMLYDATGKVVK